LEKEKFSELSYKVQENFKAASYTITGDRLVYMERMKWRLDLFDIADLDQNSEMTLGEWIIYHNTLMEKHFKNNMGGAYHLTDEELKFSFEAHDIDGNGVVTKDEITWARWLKHEHSEHLALLKT